MDLKEEIVEILINGQLKKRYVDIAEEIVELLKSKKLLTKTEVIVKFPIDVQSNEEFYEKEDTKLYLSVIPGEGSLWKIDGVLYVVAKVYYIYSSATDTHTCFLQLGHIDPQLFTNKPAKDGH